MRRPTLERALGVMFASGRAVVNPKASPSSSDMGF